MYTYIHILHMYIYIYICILYIDIDRHLDIDSTSFQDILEIPFNIVMAPQGDGALRAEMQAFDATQDWAVAEA